MPLALLAMTAWLNYRSAFAEAQQDLLRTTEVGCEHAAKMFEGQDHVVDRVVDLVRGMSPAAIHASEATLHSAFAAIVARLSQVQSVLLIDRDGRPLVSAGTYPVPDVSLRDRDYFRNTINGHAGTYVSSPQIGAVNQTLFFGLARPWTGADGAVNGVIDVAVAPAQFQDFYQALADEDRAGEGKTVALLRDDGQILASYPALKAPPPRLRDAAPFFTATRAQPDSGAFEANAVTGEDGQPWLFAYHKVQGYPLYVVAGQPRAAVIAAWRHITASHLSFAIPATLALFAITWTALIRARREAEALTRAQQEITRREQAEAALLRAQRLEAIGQLTGGVAHDFNNLLTIILGSAEMLGKRAHDPARVKTLAQHIVLAAKRGGEVTQQLLAFSRRQVVQPEILDLNAALQDFRPLLLRAARGDCTVVFDLAPRLGLVRLDPGHFEAAILNLIGNARDAMPEGGRVVIATRNLILPPADAADLPPGRYIGVAVTDTGCGMDANTAARAFEPFFTTKEVGKGTGLGLSQVYGFAKQAGGDVRIVSAPNQGATVELLLPQAEPPAPSPAIDAAAADPPSAAHQGEVVLVVEDEPGVLDMTVDILREYGYTIATATTARGALDRLRELDRVDLLLSDVTMPGDMSGVQLSIEARRLRPDLKVLLTSGYTGEFEKERPSDIPLLNKPYDQGQLASRVRTVLHG